MTTVHTPFIRNKYQVLSEMNKEQIAKSKRRFNNLMKVCRSQPRLHERMANSFERQYLEPSKAEVKELLEKRKKDYCSVSIEEIKEHQKKV